MTGLIPAHAGKTAGLMPKKPPLEAHPRSRGENSEILSGHYRPSGSSPLTRGKHQGGGLGCRRLGLIPAHAGKTERDPYSDETLSGSSPLTRGKPPRSPSRVRVMGLIPAHAGKTLVADDMHFSVPAHPRSRGENPSRRLPVDCRSGSSPLTRGKHPTLQAMLGGDGLIPAHAGKTTNFRCHRRCLTAHPRSRGENQLPHLSLSSSLGSSPLTRGKPHRVRSSRSIRRLIPAHAGKTRPSR